MVNYVSECRKGVDCEQSLVFFIFSERSVRARERRAAKPRDARNEGGSRESKKSRLAVSPNYITVVEKGYNKKVEEHNLST